MSLCAILLLSVNNHKTIINNVQAPRVLCFPFTKGEAYLMSDLTIPNTFTLLPIGAGPADVLEQAIGYSGKARFWGTYWGGGDEANHCDGKVDATGNWQGFLAYTDHPVVAAVLAAAHADLGSSETRARHILIIDRETRQVYLARISEGQRFLHAQWGPPPVLTPEELFERVKRIQAKVQAKMDAWDRQPSEQRHQAVMKRIHEQQEACPRLHTWLTQQQTHQYN